MNIAKKIDQYNNHQDELYITDIDAIYDIVYRELRDDYEAKNQLWYPSKEYMIQVRISDGWSREPFEFHADFIDFVTGLYNAGCVSRHIFQRYQDEPPEIRLMKFIDEYPGLNYPKADRTFELYPKGEPCYWKYVHYILEIYPDSAFGEPIFYFPAFELCAKITGPLSEEFLKHPASDVFECYLRSSIE